MLEIIFWALLGGACGIILACFGGGGGSNSKIVLKGSDNYNSYREEARKQAEDIVANMPKSTREELQEWNDTYHK